MALTSLKVDGKQQLVDTYVVGNDQIDGAIAGRPVTLYRKGDDWFTEKPLPDEGKIAANVLISEDLEPAIANFLNMNPTQSLDDLVDSALALFLLQQGGINQIPAAVKRRYIQQAIAA